MIKQVQKMKETMHEQNRGKRISKKKEKPIYLGLDLPTEKRVQGKISDQCTVDEWFWFWLYQYKSVTVKQGTLESYVCMYQYYIQSEFGNQPITKINGEKIQLFYNRMAKDGYAGATISLLRALLNSMFGQAYRNGYLDKNPVEQAILPKVIGKRERRVLTVQEQNLLLRYGKGNEIEGIIFTALSTGMRIGEICGLEWKNINFKDQEIIIDGTLKNTRDGKFFKDNPKTQSSYRVIPMISRLSKLFEQIKQIQLYDKTVKKENWNPISGLEHLVFTRQDGKPFTGQHIRQQLDRIVVSINKEEPELGFGHITPHTLRHTFATRALENGIPPKIVQEILGHSSIRMTLDFYTHVLPETKAGEMKKIESLFLEKEIRKFF